MRIGTLVADAAARHGLSPVLLAAVIFTESRGDPWAIRYENGYYERKLAGLKRKALVGFCPQAKECSYDTELRARATSWGLMQIMGDTARVLGFQGIFLSGLLDPAVNVGIGSNMLARLLDKNGMDIGKALLRYNGGGNPEYPGLVFTHMDNGDAEIVLRL